MALLTWADGRETWFRVVGDLTPGEGPTPVVILHGGPGAAHDYCEPIANLSRSGRACVLYDQFGCGQSGHRPDAPADFWTPQLFKDELEELTGHLGIADRYAVVGQSWGGMLAMEHALDHPRGCGRSSSPTRRAAWSSGCRGQPAARRSPAGRPGRAHPPRAGRHDRRSGVSRGDGGLLRTPCVPRRAAPDYVERSFAQIEAEPTVYHTMNGPSEFHCIGSLRTWDITARLHEIDVPTLLVSGAHDEATPLSSAPSTSASRARGGSSSRTRATCRTSRSPSASSRWSRGSSTPSTDGRVLSRSRRASSRCGGGPPAGWWQAARCPPPCSQSAGCSRRQRRWRAGSADGSGTRRRVDRARHVARRARCACARAVRESGTGTAESSAWCRGARAREEILGGAESRRSSRGTSPRSVGDVADDAEVVGDEDVGERRVAPADRRAG